MKTGSASTPLPSLSSLSVPEGPLFLNLKANNLLSFFSGSTKPSHLPDKWQPPVSPQACGGRLQNNRGGGGGHPSVIHNITSADIVIVEMLVFCDSIPCTVDYQQWVHHCWAKGSWPTQQLTWYRLELRAEVHRPLFSEERCVWVRQIGFTTGPVPCGLSLPLSLEA